MTASVVTTSVPITLPPTTTTTVPPTTTAPPTTTTAVIADATTADPKVLAAQLQAVLDRYHELYVASRTDPERPFVDDKLIADLRDLAETDVLARVLLQWQRFREEGSAVRVGPSPEQGRVLTALTPVSATTVTGLYCAYDDGITYSKADGAVLDDKTLIDHSYIDFTRTGGRWRISRMETISRTEIPTNAPNTCAGEKLS